MSKLALFLAICSTIVLASCSVTKKINKAKTETESESKVDSAVSTKKDITKETKAISETTEIIDTTVWITPKGDIVQDTANAKGKEIPVRIRKKKVTKVNADIKETDKTQTKAEVKREEKQEEKVVTKDSDIKKTSLLPTWLWILIFIVLLALTIWKFRKKLPFF